MCNALSKKECNNCSFYKHYLEEKGYEKYLPKGFKRKIEVKGEMIANVSFCLTTKSKEIIAFIFFQRFVEK